MLCHTQKRKNVADDGMSVARVDMNQTRLKFIKQIEAKRQPYMLIYANFLKIYKAKQTRTHTTSKQTHSC